MSFATYRQSQGWTLDQACEQLGLKSKGWLSRLERGEEAWPLRLALQIQVLSRGACPASGLVNDDDRKLLADFIASHSEQSTARQAEPATR